MAGYQTINDIAGADSAIADLYGQTDAVLRRVGGLTPASLGAAAATHSHLYLDHTDDDRTASSPLPNTRPRSVRFSFKNGNVLGGSIGNYTGIMTLSPWDGTTTSTGDNSYQLAFASTVANGGEPRLAIRRGIDTTWGTWRELYHSGNFNPASYLPLAGSTMTGRLTMAMNGVTWSVSPDNASYTHYRSSASSGHWFDKSISVAGEIYAGASYNQQVWHAGNFNPANYWNNSNLPAPVNDYLHSAGGLSDTNYPSGFFSTSGDYGLGGAWRHYLNFKHGDGNGYGSQLALPYGGNSSNCYYRTSTGNGWNGWILLWDSSYLTFQTS